MSLSRDYFQRPLLTDSALSPERFGFVHPGLPWREILDAYDRDVLDASMLLVDAAGVGFGANQLGTFRMIEAEAEVRANGTVVDRGDWLVFEYLPAEVAVDPETIDVWIRGACEGVAAQFGWPDRPKTLVSLLAREADNRWVPDRYGYHIAKRPYDKVCLPTRLTDDPLDFAEAMRHEYAHVMAFNRSAGRCPRWLHEAVAMVAADERPPRRVPRWLGPHDLDRAFRDSRDEDDSERRVWLAYEQSHALGLYLLGVGGHQKLGRLLDAFSDNTVVQDIVRSIINQEPVDEALRQIYRMSLRRVFREAGAAQRVLSP